VQGGRVNAPRAIIAEDEPVLAMELAEHLGRLWPELEVAARVEDGIAAVQAVERFHPQVAFLDIQMPGLSGFEVARKVAGRCHVAFVTAFDQHAVEAFEQGAVDYVMKPFAPGRLLTTVARLKEKLSGAPPDLTHVIERLAAAAVAGGSYLRWINATRGNTVRLVTVDQVLYFKADNKYTLVVTRDGESLIRKTIKELADELDPGQFWQVHRSTLVNVNAIDSVLRDIGGHVQLRLKDRDEALAVSESYLHLFRQM
jgi:DNA-binding LytR/AlgR family response regulator